MYQNSRYTFLGKLISSLIIMYCLFAIVGSIFVIKSVKDKIPVQTMATVTDISETTNLSDSAVQKEKTNEKYTMSIVYEADGKVIEKSIASSSYNPKDSQIKIKYVKGNPEELYKSKATIIIVLVCTILWGIFMYTIFHKNNKVFIRNTLTDEKNNNSADEENTEPEQSHKFKPIIFLMIVIVSVVYILILEKWIEKEFLSIF